MTTAEIQTKAHPFELSGMGRGPYTFMGMVSIPSASLAEANPLAYQNALRELPRDLIGGCGTCSNCGMGIMNICIVRDADGNHYGVGSDCVEKTGDSVLGDKVKIEVAKHRAKQARARNEAKREAQRQIWLASICSTGETNATRLEREASEKQEAQEKQQAARSKLIAILLPLAKRLTDGRGGFCDSIARDLSGGFLPTGRGLTVATEILAKQCGRYGSKAFWDEYEAVRAIFKQAENKV